MSGDVKPITGTWFDFHHPNPYEGDYWNDAVKELSAEDLSRKVKEIVDAGFETMILGAVAVDGKTFYPSGVVEDQWDMAMDDPLESVLAAGDEHGAKIYVGLGFFSSHTGDFRGTEESRRVQREVAREVAEAYGDHDSFHGWYLPVEAGIDEHFPPGYIEYANRLTEHCKELTPGKPVLIAPYGTRTIEADEEFVAQLETLEVDYIAYQDEVGVEKSEVADLDAIYRRLREVHDGVGIPLWADVEVFEFEGEVYGSELIPAPFDRVKGQLEAVTPHVDTVLCYQYWGLMNPPDNTVHLGHPRSTELYEDYREWRRGLE